MTVFCLGDIPCPDENTRFWVRCPRLYTIILISSHFVNRPGPTMSLKPARHLPLAPAASEDIFPDLLDRKFPPCSPELTALGHQDKPFLLAPL